MGESDKTPAMILVVEDEPIIRMGGVDILEEEGFRVLEAATADEALALLEQAPEVRLIFSDVDMPGSMDGVALADLVHRRWPGIRLLLTSGHRYVAGRDIPDDGRFLSKPYSHDDVIHQVNDLLGRQNLRSTTMATTPEPPNMPQPAAPQVPQPSGIPYQPAVPVETPQDDPLPGGDNPGIPG